MRASGAEQLHEKTSGGLSAVHRSWSGRASPQPENRPVGRFPRGGRREMVVTKDFG